MELAISMLVWGIGASFGALCLSSTERGNPESAWRYRLYMAYFFLAGFVLMLSSTMLGTSGRQLLLLGIFVVILFVFLAIVVSRRG